jgi:ubiquinone/menaquinone biosynthesis C-methylase UbiE
LLIHPVLYLNTGAEHLPLVSGSVDVVLARNSLDHVDDPVQALAEAQRILRPGGTFILLFDVDHAPTATEPHSLVLGEVQASLTAVKLVCQRHWDQPFGRDGHRVAIVAIKPVSE